MSTKNATEKHIFLGEYPQTLKTDDVMINDCIDGYWIGSDGERYVKIVANLTTGIGFPTPHFGNGNAVLNNQEYFFKVEPIKWLVLKENEESALLLCDKVIGNMQFCHIPYDSQDDFYDEPKTTNKIGINVIGYKNGCIVVKRRDSDANGIVISTERYYFVDHINHKIYDNNYQFSDIRKWLNTKFYNTAFNDSEKRKILTTEVDNSAKMSEPIDTKSWNDVQKQAFSRHMGDPYNTNDKELFSCENTRDKVFLVSVGELTNTDYGFPTAYGSGTNPIKSLSKKVSDYSIATGAWVSESHPHGCGWWWLRSPNLARADIVHMVRFDGRIYSSEFYPCDKWGGIVPAIRIIKK